MQPGQSKRIQATWWAVVLGFATMVSALSLVFLIFLPFDRAGPPMLAAWLVVGVGLACLFASAWISVVKLKSAADAPSTQGVYHSRFLTDTLVALALAELSVLLGIFVVSPVDRVIPWSFVGGFLAIVFLLIVPAGLSYWSKRRNGG